MNPSYWQRQTVTAPLFPDMLWSRPENRSFAGTVLIVGGNAYGFAAAGEAYNFALQAGVGSARVLLPDALQKSVSKLFPAADYAPSTPSGSFAAQALGELLPMAVGSDGVLVAGDLGRNSETAIVLESFLQKYDGRVTLTKDAIEYLVTQPAAVRNRADTLLVVSFSQLQKLTGSFKLPVAFTSSMDLVRCVRGLHDMTMTLPLMVITKHLDHILVAVNGQVSSTPCPTDERIWRLRIASGAAVWWLQNPTQPMAALSTSLVA